MEIEQGLEHDALQSEEAAQPDTMKKTKKEAKKRRMPKVLRYIGIGLIVLVLIYVIPTAKLLYDVKQAQTKGQVFKAAFEARNLDDIKKNSTEVKASIKKIQGDLIPFYPLRIIPFFGGYVSDAVHFTNAGEHGLKAVDIATESLTPYADLLGLKGNSAGQAGTAEERLQLAVVTLEKVTPRFEDISKEFTVIKQEIDHVDTRRYPKFLFGQKVSNTITGTVALIDQVGSIMVEAKPLLEQLPGILGHPQPKTYLVLFQNDKELRPSGGFLTAFTYITIDKGKITASDSNDIYFLDQQVQRACRRRECPELRVPKLIGTYLPEGTGQRKTAWDSRDSNIHPDFVASAKEFQMFYGIAGLKKVDGIIAVDTHVIQDILAVTGPVKVTGYQQEFTKDNVLGLLMAYTDYVQAGKQDRKALLGDLMGSVLRFVSDFGRDKMQPMVTTAISLLNEKHILVYIFDPNAQAAIEKLNWAGRVKEYDGDYLYVNDANFASGKANLYTNEDIDQKVEEKNGKLLKTVVIHYQNTHGYHDVLNANYRDALRLYVPKGSKVISSSGSASGKVDTYEEFNKTVFETFMFTRANGKSTFTITYELPSEINKGSEYKLLLQKQPGVGSIPVKVKILGKDIPEFDLKQDREIVIKK